MDLNKTVAVLTKNKTTLGCVILARQRVKLKEAF